MRTRWTATWIAGVAAVVISAVAVVPDAAFGQESGGSKAERAQQYADEGAKLYAEGDYGAALVQFRKAYALEPGRVLLFNIALSYSKLGRCEKAIEKGHKLEGTYELSAELDATNRGMIQGCRRAKAGRGVARRVASAGDAAAESDDPGRRAARESAEASEAVEQPDAADATDETIQETGRLGALGWTGVAAAGLSAAGWAGTLIVKSRLQDDWQRYDRAAETGDRATYDDLRESIPAKQTAGQVLLYSSIGLSAVGSTLFLVDWFGGRQEASGPAVSRVVGVVGPNRAFVGFELTVK